MKKSLQTIFLFIIVYSVSINFISCNLMKKNVMKDRADDIEESVVSDHEGVPYLVLKEEIFQATSKSDQGGFRRITGYAEYRLTSYDMNTGQMSKRIELGEREDNALEILGETGGKIWMKSVDPALGFHARDPKNLEVSVTQDKIIEVNPFLANNLSQPEWNNLSRYYGFDAFRNMPMISDNSGYVYCIDPSTLKAEKTTESILNMDFDNSTTSTSMNISSEGNLNLSGSPRSSLSVLGKKFPEPSFLKGEFLKSSNSMNPMNSNPKFFEPILQEISKYNREIDSLRTIIASLDTSGSGRSNYYRRPEHYERSIENIKGRIKYKEDEINRYSDRESFDIVSADNGVFILSQTDVTDQAKCIISKVIIAPDTTISMAWQKELSDIYRDPEKGFDKSSFEVVFSKGDPELNTMKVLYHGKKLIFILMLTAICIDTETGNVQWSAGL